MRPIACAAALLAAAIALGGCRVPYMADYADMTTFADPLPPAGTPSSELWDWFVENGYVQGPRVRQSMAELRRAPGDPLVYAVAADRRWWLTQQRTVRDLCVTQKVVYYRLDAAGNLMEAVQNHRSAC